MNEVPRVYVETSVFGGVFDEEFKRPSDLFFDSIRAGAFELVVSDVVRREVAEAPKAVQGLFDEMLGLADVAEVTTAALELRDAYLEAGVLGQSRVDDALHVALATVSRCSMIVSWNFRRIVHFDKIPLYCAVNTLLGHGPIGIHSPLEVIRYGDAEEDV